MVSMDLAANILAVKFPQFYRITQDTSRLPQAVESIIKLNIAFYAPTYN